MLIVAESEAMAEAFLDDSDLSADALDKTDALVAPGYAGSFQVLTGFRRLSRVPWIFKDSCLFQTLVLRHGQGETAAGKSLFAAQPVSTFLKCVYVAWMHFRLPQWCLSLLLPCMKCCCNNQTATVYCTS